MAVINVSTLTFSVSSMQGHSDTIKYLPIYLKAVDYITAIILIIRWFVMGDVSAEGTSYTASVMVGSQSPDREKADEVILTVVANDSKTDVGISSDSGIPVLYSI